MSQKTNKRMRAETKQTKHGATEVDTLLEHMKEDNEYESIVSLVAPKCDMVEEQRRALKEIEIARGNPCVCYMGNIIKASYRTSITGEDDLPFREMVDSIGKNIKEIDILLVTNGGQPTQVARFIDALRPRFDTVNFILPSNCMSAGTVFALSGDSIIMDDRSCLGPIDPQIPGADGAWVPAQSILVLLQSIQTEGQQLIDNGKNVPWAWVRLIDKMDQKELGRAMNYTRYNVEMVTRFLFMYKFASWKTHSSSGAIVTQEEKLAKATEIANNLGMHDKWKHHGHGITRAVATQELGIKISSVDEVVGLKRALRRFWALSYYLLEKSQVAKIFLAQRYFLVHNDDATQTKGV